jgi:hypothetical protein
VLLEQPRPELEISARLEEEAYVISVQILAKRDGLTGLVLLPVSTSSSACGTWVP